MMTSKLPDVSQKPDCDYEFSTFAIKEIKSSLAELQVLTAIDFDPEALELKIDSSDFSLAF